MVIYQSRADMLRRDEMGSLAESVNIMTEALLPRDHILESVGYAAQELMQTSRWEAAIVPVLEKIGQAADVSRAYVFENHMDADGRLCLSRRYEWTTQGMRARLPDYGIAADTLVIRP